MMKKNETICDICNINIDYDYDYCIGSFQKIEIVEYYFFNNAKIKNNKYLDKKEIDLCEKCSSDVYAYILKLKNGSQQSN